MKKKNSHVISKLELSFSGMGFAFNGYITMKRTFLIDMD